MLQKSIFVTDKLPPQARKILEGYRVFEETASDEYLSTCEVLMAWPTRASAELLGKMKGLQAFQSLSAGVDALDFSLLPGGVKVFSNAGSYTVPVAEHAWGILLGAAKGIHVRDQRVAPRMLSGKTLLVLGCGAIGTEVARLSRSIGMRTIGVSRSFRSPELFDDRRELGQLKEEVGKADAIVIALPLTKGTRGLVDWEVLALCKPEVTVANVGRGEVVVEADLLRWLRERPESRYATDVFWKRDGREVFDTAAWDLPNFAGTRHDSGVPLGLSTDGPKTDAAENVRKFLETGQAANLVDRSEYL